MPNYEAPLPDDARVATGDVGIADAGLLGRYVNVIFSALRQEAMLNARLVHVDATGEPRVYEYSLDFLHGLLTFLLKRVTVSVLICKPEDAADIFVECNARPGRPVDALTLFRNRLAQVQRQARNAGRGMQLHERYALDKVGKDGDPQLRAKRIIMARTPPRVPPQPSPDGALLTARGRGHTRRLTSRRRSASPRRSCRCRTTWALAARAPATRGSPRTWPWASSRTGCARSSRR